MTELRRSFWARHGWLKWAASGALLLLIALAVAISIAIRRAEPFLRATIVAALERRFHARVELDRFHVSLAKGVQAEGGGLRIWPPAQVEGVNVPPNSGDPLISLGDFRFHAPLRLDPGKPIHISLIELKNLEIHLPPKSHFIHPGIAA